MEDFSWLSIGKIIWNKLKQYFTKKPSTVKNSHNKIKQGSQAVVTHGDRNKTTVKTSKQLSFGIIINNYHIDDRKLEESIEFYFNKKITNLVFISIMGLLIVGDLWQVDKRYLNDSDFEKKKAAILFEKTSVDAEILKDTDPNYRVYNNTTDFDKDAITAYYHKSIGGYHGAKMRRFQELIEWQLSKNNMDCYNMLNVKYIILGDSTGQKFVQQNPATNGNAWFVRNTKIVANADEEIKALTGFNSKQLAVIDKRYENELASFKMNYDSSATIKLLTYAPNKLVYESNTNAAQLAVFSEIF
jgi:hypothetical protein